jgi:ABC-type multidrug transport system ATPase subunit
MEISLENTGKKYIHNWIFNNLNLDFSAPNHYGILGNNGSGKTTLLKVISGILTPSEGKVRWNYQGTDVSEKISRYIGWASPHLELIDEFTLEEILSFHQKFKPWVANQSLASLIKLSGLRKSLDKPLKYYSSGMKQRVKLLVAVMSDVPLIILDEPCTNLDENSIQWYQDLITEFSSDRLLIIGSNDPENECFSCRTFYTLGKDPVS